MPSIAIIKFHMTGGGAVSHSKTYTIDVIIKGKDLKIKYGTWVSN